LQRFFKRVDYGSVPFKRLHRVILVRVYRAADKGGGRRGTHKSPEIGRRVRDADFLVPVSGDRAEQRQYHNDEKAQNNRQRYHADSVAGETLPGKTPESPLCFLMFAGRHFSSTRGSAAL
jgi:hypothetical protein